MSASGSRDDFFPEFDIDSRPAAPAAAPEVKLPDLENVRATVALALPDFEVGPCRMVGEVFHVSMRIRVQHRG